MRIIAGKYRSRILLRLAKLITRPVMDSVKERIFNIIGPYFDGGSCLDVFLGSGSLGLEALSRGIKRVVGSEQNGEAYNVLLKNYQSLGEKDNLLFKGSYEELFKKIKGESFSLVFIDPPYRLNLGHEILEEVIERKFITKGYIVVFASLVEPFKNKDLVPFREFIQGQCHVRIYKI